MNDNILNDKRIFIVEDDTMNRVVYNITLKRYTQWIEFDRFGRNVITKLIKTHYDLIILDLMLSFGESGFSIFRDIKKLSDYAHVPIVAISASEPSVSIPKAKELGFDGYITKPIDKNILPKQLACILNGEPVWS